MVQYSALADYTAVSEVRYSAVMVAGAVVKNSTVMQQYSTML